MKNDIILYVIRHGKTYCNEKRLYCGKSDISLSETGKKEIEKLKETINYPICKLNYTSGAKRANETFKILYPSLGYIEKRDFFEYDFGEFEMQSYDILKENKNYINWITDSTRSVKCPNGESKLEFYSRITKGLDELINDVVAKGEEEALLLCHGGTIGTLLELFHHGDIDFYNYQPSFGRGYKLLIRKNKEFILDILEEL